MNTKFKKLKRLIRSNFKKHLKTMSSKLKKLRLLIRSKIKQVCADLSTLKNAFWDCKTGFLPVFLETLIKHFILLVLVYLVVIYTSAYYIFKMHDAFYHEFGYVLGFVTAALIYDLPLIIHNYILMTPVEWGAISILKESLSLYFTLHWGHALALGLLIINVLYFFIGVCKLIWTTLGKSNNVWDRSCAYLLLSLLVVIFILFLVYWLTPFFSDVYNQGWATTVVSYLWKSLNFLTRFQHRRTARANKYQQKHCYENTDMGTESHYESHASNAKV